MRRHLPACFALVLLAASSAQSGTAKADPAPSNPSTAEKTVDMLNTIWGKHPGQRANHAKGQVVEGQFTPAPEAAKLSKATLFAGKTVPITVRFSDSSGLPALPDGDPKANPHGMAIKFHLDDGDMDIVANSLHFFPVANGEDFLALLRALAASPPNAPKPTALDTFIAAHPSVPKALASAQTPSSLARETYYSVDAFIFVDAAGKRQPFRFQIRPEAGAEHLSPAAAAKQAPDFLMNDIVARIGKAPVRFTLVAQLADAGDPIADPTKEWPADRKTVTLGTLTLDKVDPDSAAAAKKLLFLPTNLVDGIEASDDPLISARTQAYGVSFGRRSAP